MSDEQPRHEGRPYGAAELQTDLHRGDKAADRNTAAGRLIRGRLIGGRGDLLIHKKLLSQKAL